MAQIVVVLQQILGLLGHPGAGQVIGRGHHDGLPLKQGPRHDVAVVALGHHLEAHEHDGHGQTDHQAEEHRKHPLPAAFEELLHHNVVHAVACDLGFSDNRFGCGSGILCERTNGTQYGQGSRRNQKKFFHSCVG